MRLEIKKFSWDDILPHKIKKLEGGGRWQPQAIEKKLKANSSAFTHWVARIVKEYVQKPPHGKKWNSLCVYMNEKNLEYLYSQMDTWLYMDIGPKCSNKLADNEYAVNPAEVLVDTP